jgi:hypothetical protein
MNEPPITVVGLFPFIYLPTVLVVFAYSFHILSLRQLYLLRQAERRYGANEQKGTERVITSEPYKASNA